MNVYVIKLGDFKVDGIKNFDYLLPNDESRLIKLAIQPFVVATTNDILLLDVGLGFLEDGEPVVLKRLKDHSIQPEAITKILVSHLHKDHTDGLGYFKGTDFIQNFPDSAIYIQKREYEYALEQKKSHSYNQLLLNALKFLPNVVWMEDEEGIITNEVRFKVTGGHTPFHQVFWIEENGQTYFYGADNLPTYGYLKQHIAFKTDYDGYRAMEWRKTWEKEARENHWHILLYHDLKTAVLRF